MKAGRVDGKGKLALVYLEEVWEEVCFLVLNINFTSVNIIGKSRVDKMKAILKKNPAAPPRNESPADQPRNESPAAQPRNETSAAQPRMESSAAEPRMEGAAAEPR